eukprot:6210331-Prymnesium_polylepis.1
MLPIPIRSTTLHRTLSPLRPTCAEDSIISLPASRECFTCARVGGGRQAVCGWWAASPAHVAGERPCKPAGGVRGVGAVCGRRENAQLLQGG